MSNGILTNVSKVLGGLNLPTSVFITFFVVGKLIGVMNLEVIVQFL